MIRLHQNHRKGQAHPRQGFRHRDDIRLDAHLFKGKERACPTATGLNVIDNQQCAMLLCQCRDGAHPVSGGSVQTAFPLDRFHQNGRGCINATGRIFQHFGQDLGGIHIITQIAIIGYPGNTIQRRTIAAPVIAIASRGQRACRHTMEAIGEGYDIRATGDLAGQLDRGLYRIRAGRAGELQAIVHIAWLQDDIPERFQEITLGIGVHVQTMGDPIGFDIVNQGGLHVRVVMTVIQGRATGQKVCVIHTILCCQRRIPGTAKHHRKGATIAADFGFNSFKGGKRGSHSLLRFKLFHFCELVRAQLRQPGIGL